MRKILIGLGIVILLLVVAVVALPFLIPTDVVVRRVEALVEQRTGRDLQIAGPVDLQIVPNLAVRLSDVTLANAEGATAPNMVSLGELDAQIALLPLLGGAVEVDRFVLRQPTIALEVDEQGRGNWEFATAAPAEQATPEPEPDPTGGATLGNLSFGDVRIIDGDISYTDRRSGATYALSDTNATFNLGDLSGPVAVEGSAVFQEQPVEIALTVDDASVLTGSGRTPILASLESEPLDARFEGTAQGGNQIAASGAVSLTVPSLRALAAWLQVPLPPDLPVDSVNLQATAEGSPSRVALQGMTLALDDINATGDLTAALDGERPRIEGDIAVTALDLDRLLGAPAPDEPASDAAGSAEDPGAAAPAADPPIDLSPLTLADADLTLRLAGVTVRGTEVGSSTIDVTLENGVLDLATSDTALFGGTAAVNLSADATAAPRVAIDADLDAIDLAALPVPVANVGGLSGRLSGTVAVQGQGRTQSEMLAGLDGQTNLALSDGAVTYDMGDGAAPIAVSGLNVTVEGTPQQIALRDLRLTADGVPAEGELTLALSGARPAVAGTLRTGRLDLDRYLPPPAPEGGAQDGTGQNGAAAPAGAEAWSTEPIDFSALRLLDADLDLSADGIVARGIETGPTSLGIDLADGDLNARLAETSLFGGTVGGAIALDSAAETPQLALQSTITNVEAEPLLTQLADFTRLIGTMNGTLDVNAAGRSQQELVETLTGNSAILFSDGAVKGINIAAMLRNLSGAFDAANRGDDQQTDFAELGGTFDIQQGTVATQDLRMLAPLFRLEGQGQADLPQRTLDFRLVPRLVATVEGQGGQQDLGGLAVPIIVSGTFSDPSFRPDLAGAIENTLRDPAALSDQIEALGDDPAQALRGLLGGAGGAAPAEPEQAPGSEQVPQSAPEQAEPAPEPQDPAQQLLEGLLGGEQDGQQDGAAPAQPLDQLRGLFGN